MAYALPFLRDAKRRGHDMTTTTAVITDNPAALADLLAALGRGLVVFDGCPAAGKTTLMRDMAARLDCKAFDADAYLNRKQGTFVNALRFDELGTVIRNVATSSLVLMASLCARQVIERLGLSGVTFVYVQRNSSVGLAADLDDLDAETDENIPDPIELNLMTALYREVRAYHTRYRPFHNANLVYVRTSP
jgi:hypothetical protein